MKLFPEHADVLLEFDKIKKLLENHCRTEFAKHRAQNLRVHTKKDFIELELSQTHELHLINQTGQHLPIDFIINIHKELKLLSIPGAILSGEQFLLIKKLCLAISHLFRWFDNERRIAYPNLASIIEKSYYEKNINDWIDETLDDIGVVRDNASPELQDIRAKLFRKRNELRRIFGRVVVKLRKQGFLADIEEAFINGRKVLAVFAEQKRMIKGILHGESDSRKTSFIEPEETITINNEIFELENEERKEVERILRQLTQNISVYASLLKDYLRFLGEFDFVDAKAKLAADMNAHCPVVHDKAIIKLINAYHPLLYLYNKQQNKQTIPLNISLDDHQRILVISGPNAGGKTVSMKTIGLNQLMVQSGLFVPVHPDSEMGIFKQLMIHIGDTQNLEFELSTYSSHLKHMKYFLENANGKTLFFIDELGSGSDPNLGGAFAEVILEELAHKHSFGVATTHYLNLKVMANKVSGIVNGAMLFDQEKLEPLYKLVIGKPGSSYTFAIAERIGIPQRLINRARKLVDDNHFTLDKLLNRTEQDLQKIESDKIKLEQLLKENQKLRREMEHITNKEKHRQEIEKLKEQNKINEEKINYLKDMERKLKSLVQEWRKTEHKEEVIKMMNALLFKQKEKQVTEKVKAKLDKKFIETDEVVEIGKMVKLPNNRQTGVVLELRGKNAVVKIGQLPITVSKEGLKVITLRATDQ